MARRQSPAKKKREFSDEELSILYDYVVRRRSVSEIALERYPENFEKKPVWKYTKNRIYALVWKLRKRLAERGKPNESEEKLLDRLKRESRRRRGRGPRAGRQFYKHPAL